MAEQRGDHLRLWGMESGKGFTQVQGSGWREQGNKTSQEMGFIGERSGTQGKSA